MQSTLISVVRSTWYIPNHICIICHSIRLHNISLIIYNCHIIVCDEIAECYSYQCSGKFARSGICYMLISQSLGTISIH